MFPSRLTPHRIPVLCLSSSREQNGQGNTSRDFASSRWDDCSLDSYYHLTSLCLEFVFPVIFRVRSVSVIVDTHTHKTTYRYAHQYMYTHTPDRWLELCSDRGQSTGHLHSSKSLRLSSRCFFKCHLYPGKLMLLKTRTLHFFSASN